MLVGAVLVAVLLVSLCGLGRKEPPLDGPELRRLRRFADRLHREQSGPYS